MWKNVLASYIHLHFASAPELAPALLLQCRSVDINLVNAAAAKAAADMEDAMAAAAQQQPLENGHRFHSIMNTAYRDHGEAHAPTKGMSKIMSTPDLTIPLQRSSRSIHNGRLSGDSSFEDGDRVYTHSHMQPAPQQHQHSLHLQHRQTAEFAARDRGLLSPQRTSSLPIIHRQPAKPYSLPASPLHEVAEQHAVHKPLQQPTSRMALPQSTHTTHQLGVSPSGMSPHDYMQYRHQLPQQLPQQLDSGLSHYPQQQPQLSPFHSPLQASSLHATPSPPYPSHADPNLTHLNGYHHASGALQPNMSVLAPEHSHMVSAQSGMLSSVQSGMLPDGALYQPGSAALPDVAMYQPGSSMMPEGAVYQPGPAMLSHQAKLMPQAHSAFASHSLKASPSGLLSDGHLHTADGRPCSANAAYRGDDTGTASTSARQLGHVVQGGRWLPNTGSSRSSHSPSAGGFGIVSLLPSGTEILYALGLGDRYAQSSCSWSCNGNANSQA